MKKTINTKWLKKHDACLEGIKVFQTQKERNPVVLINQMIKEKNYLGWANWLIVRLMNKKQQVMYAIYAAEQVIDIFEKAYPDDDRPQKAIDAAKAYLKNPCKKTKEVAEAAADAAGYAANAAYADYVADFTADAIKAAYAAIDVAYAAAYADYVADFTTDAVGFAADAAKATYANYAAAQIRILKYGLKILNN